MTSSPEAPISLQEIQAILKQQCHTDNDSHSSFASEKSQSHTSLQQRMSWNKPEHLFSTDMRGWGGGTEKG